VAEITEADVIQALQGVQDPELNKDFTELGMIRDVRASSGVISLTVVLTTPACPLKDEIGNRVRGALMERIPDVTAVNIDFGSQVVAFKPSSPVRRELQVLDPSLRRPGCGDARLVHVQRR